MALKITLKPHERMVVNGCVIRNSDRRHVLMIENRADVVRGEDLLGEDIPATPVKEAYFLIQTALIQPDLRSVLVPKIQTRLVDIATIYSVHMTDGVFEAANFVAVHDFYKAMAALRALMRHEEEVQATLDAQLERDTPQAPLAGVLAPGAEPELAGE
ncbi:flbT protein [Defluviimonas sp. 20V17]|uniref:Flagellar protein FlbT n=1 Tax=Allgaiera indica TaxID=765699 RepID=A0AAN4UNP6_9RHOB|nr:flagellar biosynthesis repressor FlbT [Allgaiera indica]KDB03892.1 flbT protein [Defluviimonas sp. 20V17]GHD99262.1 putative flagellum biosynthesis repressor protein FlbT 1 [Allgaiera indica]SDW30295.1 flagellar protein FlbT [Allgaiera indica]